jgi:hypothetical protein
MLVAASLPAALPDWPPLLKSNSCYVLPQSPGFPCHPLHPHPLHPQERAAADKQLEALKEMARRFKIETDRLQAREMELDRLDGSESSSTAAPGVKPQPLPGFVGLPQGPEHDPGAQQGGASCGGGKTPPRRAVAGDEAETATTPGALGDERISLLDALLGQLPDTKS